MFNLPSPDEGGEIVTGTVKTVSANGLSFEPDRPALAASLKPDETVSGCSLRAGEKILSPCCTVRRTGEILSLEFASFPQGEKEAFDAFLGELPLREMRARKARA
jgi:hypothetical protein